MKIGGASLNQTPLDWRGNLRRIKKAIDRGMSQKIDLLCFPELSLTGYGCEDLFLSKWISDKSEKYLYEILDSCEGITVAVGLPVRYKNKTYNCSCVIRDKKILGIIAKQNMAIDGVHYESRWFSPWPSEKSVEINYCGQNVRFGDVIIKMNNFLVGFEICEDAWREQRPAIVHHRRNVDIILNPSASHFALEKTKERQHLIVTSSEKYDCIYVYVNLLGNEAGRMIYDGEIIIAKKGRMLALNEQLSFKDVNILSVSVDRNDTDAGEQEIHPTRQREFEFVQATSLALFDYLRKSKADGFVLSLSGGADSSTCAVLVSEMVSRGIRELGLEQFLSELNKSELLKAIGNQSEDQAQRTVVGSILSCAYQATKNSSDETFLAAEALAKDLGAQFLHWRIDNSVSEFISSIENVINRKLDWKIDDIALQNVQARARSPYIWLLANIKKCILLTTSNRSEGDVGYATMDGDTSGSLAPIAGIDKAFIRSWLKWAQVELGIKGLEKVNNLIPSAELRPREYNQTDEDDLMPYEIMVEIERLAIRDHLSPRQVFENLKERNVVSIEELKKFIHKFFSLWSHNQWKRERLAPSFHLDDFNIDPRSWCRYPILSGGFEEELQELHDAD